MPPSTGPSTDWLGAALTQRRAQAACIPASPRHRWHEPPRRDMRSSDGVPGEISAGFVRCRSASLVASVSHGPACGNAANVAVARKYWGSRAEPAVCFSKLFTQPENVCPQQPKVRHRMRRHERRLTHIHALLPKFTGAPVKRDPIAVRMLMERRPRQQTLGGVRSLCAAASIPRPRIRAEPSLALCSSCAARSQSTSEVGVQVALRQVLQELSYRRVESRRVVVMRDVAGAK
jgi:hypothetical protein